MLSRNHLLIITKDYEPQWFELSAGDLMTSYLALSTLKGFAFYNSDKRAGASQRHKHLQSKAV